MTDSASNPLEVRLLGQFDLRMDGQRVELPSRPAQSLFAYLVLTSGTAHRREKLAGLFWPDASESNARSNLRHALWRIRQAVGVDRRPGCGKLLADNVSITFERQPGCWVDVIALEAGSGPGASLEDQLESLSVYGGELLPGFYEDWVLLERERIKAAFDRKLQRLLEQLIAAQRWPAVLEWGERWIALGQFPEPAYRALMTAYAGLGDLSSVASAFQRCVAALRDELGIEPSEQTKEAFELLRGGLPPQAQLQRAPSVESIGGRGLRTLFDQWRRQGITALDMASLALVRASPDGTDLEKPDVDLLIRSILHHGLDLGPWCKHIGTVQVAAAALKDAFEEYPKPESRMQIVEALSVLPGAESTQLLLQIVGSDDSAAVRSAAAMAAARSGHLDEVVDRLLRDMHSLNEAAAVAALIRVADEVGLPRITARYPRLPVAWGIASRRWQSRRGWIIRQMLRSGLGGAVALMLIGGVQILVAEVVNPIGVRQTLEFMPLPIWVLSSAILGVMWGGLLGMATGLFVGLADTVARSRKAPRWRIAAGAAAGLVHSFFLIMLSATGGLQPNAPAAVYVPVDVLFGLLVGTMLILVVPLPDRPVSTRDQLGRAIMASAGLIIVSLPLVFVLYREASTTALPLYLLFAVFFPLGPALALRARRNPEQEWQR
jgi:DNA-binding SARP family transcriptional activator